MFKSDKGITLTVIIITIIIMGIIFAVTIRTGDDLLRNTQKDRLRTNMYLIKARAESLLSDYLFDFENPLDNSISNETKAKYLKGIVITDFAKVKSVGFEVSSSDFSGVFIYCEWNLSVLKEQGISTSNIANNESFIIQYSPTTDEVNVASVRGFSEKNGLTYHKLSEFEQMGDYN